MSSAAAAAPLFAPPAYTHAQIKRVVTGIMLCILLAALDQTVVIPAVPAIAAELERLRAPVLDRVGLLGDQHRRRRR